MSPLQVTERFDLCDLPSDVSKPFPSDSELLHEFTSGDSEAAFAEIVKRHGDLVYSSALRQLNDHAMAQDVAQAVFIILARKAHLLGQGVVLVGWLFNAVRFAVN